MNVIVGILQGILAPLSSDLLLAALIAGIFFGAIYNHTLRLPGIVVYHQLVSGVGFIFFLFIFRWLSALVTGALISNPLGWIGIALLWAVFCLCTRLGQIGAEDVVGYIKARKVIK